MEPNLNCLRCQSGMIEGFAITEQCYRIAKWFDGLPKAGLFGITKVKMSEAKSARSFRCPKCGYTEMNVQR